MNAQDVLNRARTEGVELIRFMYCDFTGVQRGKITAIDDLANRLSHGINLTNAQMAFTLINTIVPIEGMSPVGELRMVPDPETFTILPWMPEHASMNCDLLQKNGERYGACPRTFLKDVINAPPIAASASRPPSRTSFTSASSIPRPASGSRPTTAASITRPASTIRASSTPPWCARCAPWG